MSLAAWKTVRLAYRMGASEGLIGRIYSGLRHGADYNKPSLMLNLLGRDITRAFRDSNDVILVAHPVLVAVLKGKGKLVYQHGELAAPTEAVVRGADRVLVPSSEAAKPFLESGYSENQLLVTGLCIEPALVRQASDAYHPRLLRINGQEPLTGGFFSSGAEPKAHVEKLVTAAGEAVIEGGTVILFAGPQGRLLRKARDSFRDWQIEYGEIGPGDPIPAEPPEALIIRYSSRRELNIFTEQFFGMFDYFVSPSHERTNWALGLGLPMFIVGPAYGPFAPINERILIEAKVARNLDESAAGGFGEWLTDLRQHGYLSEMAQSGFEKRSIDGFSSIADFFINYCGSNSL